MNLKKYCVALCLLLASAANAQITVSMFSNDEHEDKLINPQPVVGKVFYDFSYLPDTAKTDSLTKEVFELNFAKNASMFSSYSSRMRDSAMKKMFEEAEKNATVDADGKKQLHFGPPVVTPNNQTYSRDKFYTEAQSIGTSLYIINLITTVFEIKDTAEKINWQISDSTKNIQGNLCQKAIGESHGRLYTAWFCSDIPYSFGPRRLSGLPGLILVAYDEKHQVNYMFDHIETIKDTAAVIGLPKDGIETTPKEFIKAREAFEKNPNAFIQAHMPQQQGIKMNLTVVKGIPPKGFKKPVNNNPIDLQ